MSMYIKLHRIVIDYSLPLQKNSTKSMKIIMKNKETITTMLAITATAFIPLSCDNTKSCRGINNEDPRISTMADSAEYTNQHLIFHETK